MAGSNGATPHAPESEATVLGLAMVDPDAAVRLVDLLDPDDFYREGHRQVWRAMLRLFRRGETLGWHGVADELLAMGRLEEAGGKDYLARLHDGVSLAADPEGHASRVLDASRRRRLLAALRESMEDVASDAETAEVFDRVEQRVFDISDRGQRGGPARIGKNLDKAFAEIERRSKAKDGVTGIPTGLRDIDGATGGLQPENLVVLAARPGMGKTALAVQIAMNEALRDDGGSVLLFSMEMSRQELQWRALALESLANLSHIVRGRLDDDELPRLVQAASIVGAARLTVDATSALNPLEIRARSRKAKATDPDLSLIVVDYLQLMAGTGQENRQQEVSEISRSLKALAKDLGIPVLALSQLSRAPEQRSTHRPTLSDLRESGAIEQDADVVMFLYRPEYYLPKGEAEQQRVVGHTELIFGKNRNGPTDTIELYFRAASVRFENATRHS